MDRHSVPPGGPSQNPRELRLGLRPQVSRTGPGEAGEGSIRQTTPQHETLGPLDSPKDKLRTSGQARWEGCCSTSSNMGRAPPSSDSCRQTARQATAQGGHAEAGPTGRAAFPGDPRDGDPRGSATTASMTGHPGAGRARAAPHRAGQLSGGWTPDPRPASNPHPTGREAPPTFLTC